MAIQTLKALQAKGLVLILWTYCKGKELDEAVRICEEKGLVFHAVNKNYQEEVWGNNESRKILADVYINDRNLGGIPSWGEIFRMQCPDEDIGHLNKVKPWWKI